MARIFTTPDSMQKAKSFMHDVMVAAGIRSSQRQNSNCAFKYPSEIKAAQAVCDELINRDFKNIDSSIRELSRPVFTVSLTDGGKLATFKAEAVAKAIVYMAELTNIYWDDTDKTPYEVEEFKKTILGEAVYKYGRYISAIPEPTTKSSTAKAATSQGTGATPKTSTAANSGKPVGPQSANIRDLRGPDGNPGTPGQKVYADGDVMYKIIGDKTGSNTPNAFINPLSRSGASGSTNKVKFSSGNGWTDCQCLFDNHTDAQDFLVKLLQNDADARTKNAKVVQCREKADPNGYFLVGTEYGICAINARKMNEALAEAATRIEEAASCWENATKKYSQEELRELNDWMRRD